MDELNTYRMRRIALAIELDDEDDFEDEPCEYGEHDWQLCIGGGGVWSECAICGALEGDL